MPDRIINPINNKLSMYADDSNLKISAKSKNRLELEDLKHQNLEIYKIWNFIIIHINI